MSKVLAFAGVTLLLAGGALVCEAQPGPPSCESLAPLALAGAKVTSAQAVAAGAFTPPADLPPWMAGDPSLYKNLPAFCRVLAVARPSADSEIKIEAW